MTDIDNQGFDEAERYIRQAQIAEAMRRRVAAASDTVQDTEAYRLPILGDLVKVVISSDNKH